jgi:hypothetical protein
MLDDEQPIGSYLSVPVLSAGHLGTTAQVDRLWPQLRAVAASRRKQHKTSHRCETSQFMSRPPSVMERPGEPPHVVGGAGIASAHDNQAYPPRYVFQQRSGELSFQPLPESSCERGWSGWGNRSKCAWLAINLGQHHFEPSPSFACMVRTKTPRPLPDRSSASEPEKRTRSRSRLKHGTHAWHQERLLSRDRRAGNVLPCGP